MKKAANGSGMQPIKRADGRWMAMYSAGTDPITGKAIRRSVYGKNQKECAQKLRDAVAKIDNGTYIEPNAMKLSVWLDKWINEYHGNVKASTKSANKSICENHIKPSAIGSMRIDHIQKHDVQAFINSLYSKSANESKSKETKEDSTKKKRVREKAEPKTLSYKTVKNIHGTLSKALAQAVENGYIRINPATGAHLRKPPKFEMNPLDEATVARFNDIVGEHMYADIYRILLMTGMRLGEALGLRWKNIDFDKGTINIESQLSKDTQCIDTPKNGKGRTITVMPEVLRILKRVRIKQNEMKLQKGDMWKPNTITVSGKQITDLVFTNKEGEHLRHSSVSNCFQRILKNNGLERYRVHDLRHTFATRCIALGMDVVTLSNLLGHSSREITLNRYCHSTQEMEKNAIAKLSAGWI